MDLRQLEILRAVADTGSFTAAGHQLHLSQSAVSRQILLLEEELEEQVFLRIGGKIKITQVGTTLLALSRRVFDDIEATRASIVDSRKTLAGTIRLIGGMTVSTILTLFVIPASYTIFDDLSLWLTRKRRAKEAARSAAPPVVGDSQGWTLPDFSFLKANSPAVRAQAAGQAAAAKAAAARPSVLPGPVRSSNTKGK